MVLDYFGIKLLINTNGNIELENMIIEKYSPVIRISNLQDSTLENFDFTINAIISNEPLFDIDNDFRRRILHGGNKQDYYITGLTKMQDMIKKIYVDDYQVYVLSKVSQNKIVCQGKNTKSVLKILDLVIIELFYRSIETNNTAFHFHASAIVDENHNGTIFTGNKNAGKTTFLFESIFNKKFSYVCNDNCFIERTNSGEIIIVPWFEDIKVKYQTMNQYHLDTKFTNQCETSADGMKVYIPLFLALKNLNLNYVGDCRLKRIIILEYSEGKNKIERDWKPEFFEEIYNNVKVPHDPEHYELLGIFDEFSSERFNELKLLINYISTNIEVIKVYYDISSLQDTFEKVYSIISNN